MAGLLAEKVAAVGLHEELQRPRTVRGPLSRTTVGGIRGQPRTLLSS